MVKVGYLLRANPFIGSIGFIIRSLDDWTLSVSASGTLMICLFCLSSCAGYPINFIFLLVRSALL